jgi:Bacteriophage baseplate protein W
MNLAYPYGFDSRRCTADAEDEVHVRDLIEQLLFTQPGERVMRPTLGSGVMHLVFAPNSPELAGATQMLVQGALTQWLAGLAGVQDVRVEADDSQLSVTVRYIVLATGEEREQVFTRDTGGAP